MQKAIRDICDTLAQNGNRIIDECAAEINYQHQTFNLIDSYGFGVYYNGALERTGYYTAQPAMTKRRNWYGKALAGREEIKNFLQSEYRPKSKGFELVIAAAMPYGKILETGGGNLRRKYKVISMAYDKLQDLSKNFKGSIVIPLTGGKI